MKTRMTTYEADRAPADSPDDSEKAFEKGRSILLVFMNENRATRVPIINKNGKTIRVLKSRNARK